MHYGFKNKFSGLKPEKILDFIMTDISQSFATNFLQKK